MTYPLDSDLTDGWCYLPFEQLGPVLQGKNLLVTLKQASFNKVATQACHEAVWYVTKKNEVLC